MKTKMPYAQALGLAEKFITQIRPMCDRVEIAGSLRRKKDQVGDIEIVCIPKIVKAPDMFGYAISSRPIDEIGARFKLVKNGPNYKQLDMGSYHIDLFITTPAQWGVIFTIRTGSADFSHWLVTPRSKGGGCPSYLKVKDGRIDDGHKYIATPEEQDVFTVMGIPYIEPEKRIEGHWTYGREPFHV